MFAQKVRHSPVMLVVAAVLVVALFAKGDARSASAAIVAASAKAHYGDLPLSFIANAGQSDPSIRFQVRGSGGTLSFDSTGVSLSLPAPANPARIVGTLFLPSENNQIAMRLAFDGANPNSTLDGANQLAGIANFFIGNDPHQWHTNVPTYAGVVYRNLYPGVDLRYAGHTGLLKGTYTLAAGVDPNLIRWQYRGAANLMIDSVTGDLLILGPAGVQLREKAPIAWQMHDGLRIPVEAGYQIGQMDVQFTIGAYDPTLPLTIDPGLDYSTYLGGNNFDQGEGIAVDGGGNVYVTGDTYSANFPTTSGAFQTALSGTYDAFVSKLNATGSALVYSTYLGGASVGYGIAVDSSGNAYVTGDTQSTSFPTTSGAFQTTYGGGLYDAFMSKLNATGNALLYSTYLGGSINDFGEGITIDSNGIAYIVGYTISTNFPTTAGAFKTSGDGSGEVTITKLNPAISGTAGLIYSTYLGGNGNDSGFGIALDSNGNIYTTGYTNSSNFPTTSGAFQTTYGGGTFDAFVSKFNPAASGAASLVYSTYLGGSGSESGAGIAVDGSGNAYVVGSTASTNFPVTGGSFQTSYGGGTDDGFVTRLNASGTALVYSTYLGGSGTDFGSKVAVDSSGNAYIVGSSVSGNFPTTPGALQTTFGGGSDDAIVTKLNATGNALLYSTYLGGSGTDNGQGLALDSNANVYIVGTTTGSFPTTAGAVQPGYAGGGSDAFIAKLELAAPTITLVPPTLPTAVVGVAYSRTLNAHSTDLADAPFSFVLASGTLPLGLTLNANSGTLSGTPATEGTYVFTISATDKNGYSGSQTYAVSVSPVIGLNPAVLPNPTLNQAYNQTLTAYGGQGPYTFAVLSGGLPTGLTLSSAGVLSGTPTASGTFTFTVTAIDALYFTGTQGYTLTVSAPNQTIGIYRPSVTTFFLHRANSTGYADYSVPFGSANSLPLAGDWNGDGIDTVGTLNTSNGLFTLTDGTLPNPPVSYSFVLGNPGDTPFAGRWDNTISHDGVGVFRPSNGLLYLKDQLTTGFADYQMVLGIPGDQGIAGDWDGNGFDSPGVYRPANNTFFLSNQVCNCSVFADNQATFGSGGAGALAFTGDWIGNGHTGVGLFLNGQVALKNYPYSGSQADISFVFGVSGDEPIAGFWGATGSVAHPLTPNPNIVLVPPTPIPESGRPSPSGGLGD